MTIFSLVWQWQWGQLWRQFWSLVWQWWQFWSLVCEPCLLSPVPLVRTPQSGVSAVRNMMMRMMMVSDNDGDDDDDDLTKPSNSKEKAAVALFVLWRFVLLQLDLKNIEKIFENIFQHCLKIFEICSVWSENIRRKYLKIRFSCIWIYLNSLKNQNGYLTFLKGCPFGLIWKLFADDMTSISSLWEDAALLLEILNASWFLKKLYVLFFFYLGGRSLTLDGY